MIDLHTHVLPGLDDGVATVEEALAMCRKAAGDGIELLVATPHVRHDYPFTPEEMGAALGRVREAADGLVEILPGGEVDADELNRPLEEILAFGLGGNPSYLLLETPYSAWGEDVDHAVERLLAGGIVPVLAHPERNRAVQREPEVLRPLVAAGALVQLTAASLDGRGGKSAERCAFRLLDLRLAHVLASDAHAPHVREIGFAGALAALGDPALGRWLTDDVPKAIVGGLALPARPGRPRLFGRLRGRTTAPTRAQ